MTDRGDIIDATGWVGRYPFREIPGAELDAVAARAAGLGIVRTVVSSFDELFAENGLDAARRWSDRLAGRTAFEHWPVVNPAMPGALDALPALLDDLAPRGLRLLPNYHGYRLSNPPARALLTLAGERGLVVQIFQRIADERWQWMLRVGPTPEADIAAALAGHPDVRLLISGMNAPAAIVDALAEHPAACADLSRVRSPLFAVEKLCERVAAERIVFGSLHPLQTIEAVLWPILDARIDESDRRGILAGNFRRLVGERADPNSPAAISPSG